MANLSSQSMTEFCEQADPHVLLETRRSRPFPQMLRVQESWVEQLKNGHYCGWPRASHIASVQTISLRSAWRHRLARERATRSRPAIAARSSESSSDSPSTGSATHSTAHLPAFANACAHAAAFTSTTWSIASAPSR